MYSVVILESQFIFRKGLSHLFDEQDTFTLEASYTEFEDALREMPDINPRIIIVGTYATSAELEGFLNAVKRHSQIPEFMVIANELEYEKINHALSNGVKSVLTRNCSKEEIFLALNSLVQGNRFLCDKVLDVVLNKPKEQSEKVVSDDLTEREKEILALIAKGNSTQQISDFLHVSVHTVNTHRKNIIKKLKIKSPVELIVYAIQNGYGAS